MEKVEMLEKRIEGEIERRVVEERKVKEKITKLERKTQELEEENQRLKENIKKMREELGRVTRECSAKVGRSR